MATDISDGFGTFLDKYRAQNEQNVEWLMAFGDRLRDLSQQYRDVRLDLDRERIAGRHAQENAEKWEHSFRTLEESVHRNAFVLVLVDADADAYLFDEKYFLEDPAEGGEKAASDLRVEVRKYLHSVDPSFGDLPVIIKAFASGDGLAHLLVKASVAKQRDAQSTLLRFTSGFSQADDISDFVLVGKGKDRADHKLLGAFRQSIENPCCRHIIFAACHDNGYVRTLEKYVHNSTFVKKVSLLKSFQVGNEFTSLPFESITMESVFRTRPIMPLSPASRSGVDATPGPSNTSMNSSPPVTSRELPATSTVPSQHNLSTRTYAMQAAAARSPQPQPQLRPLPLFGTIDADTILVNADGCRLDLPLPARSMVVVERLHQKIKLDGKRYCNMYQLGGSCAGGCGYLHDPLSDAEKLVLRHRLRGEMCHVGGNCREPRCFYGHHCYCSRTQKCNFPAEMHNVEVSTWRIVVRS